MTVSASADDNTNGTLAVQLDTPGKNGFSNSLELKPAKRNQTIMFQ